MTEGREQMKYNTKSILEMDNGAYMELADYEMLKIMNNILDPNAKNKPRKLDHFHL